MSDLDCRRCGACCCNTRDNIAQDYHFYVEIDPDSEMLARPALRRWVVEDEEGVPHMRMEPSGRCSALAGPLGERVTCKVYAHRPSGCRRVSPGDEECLQARAAWGIS